MIKNIKLNHSIVYDFLLSISRLINNDYQEQFFRSYDGNLIDKYKFDDNLNKWIKLVYDKLPLKYKNLMDFYFNCETKWCMILLYYSYINKYTKIEELISFLENSSMKEIIAKKIFLFSRHCKNYPQISEQEAFMLLDEQKELMRFIEKTPFSAKRKWEFLHSCLNPEKVKEELVDLLKWYYETIYTKEIKKVEKIVKKYEKELDTKLKKYGKEYLSILINSDYSFDDNSNKTITLIISYFWEIGYLLIMLDTNDEDVYFLGFRHMEIFVERKHGILSNVHVFKALGDETRQNMIKLLSKREWYGDELAQEMNLSNSTVSYHLSILLLEGFVKVKRVDNRTYFILNTDNLVKTLTDALNRMINNCE